MWNFSDLRTALNYFSHSTNNVAVCLLDNNLTDFYEFLSLRIKCYDAAREDFCWPVFMFFFFKLRLLESADFGDPLKKAVYQTCTWMFRHISLGMRWVNPLSRRSLPGMVKKYDHMYICIRLPANINKLKAQTCTRSTPHAYSGKLINQWKNVN